MKSYVAWATRHGPLLWTLALLLAIPATVRTVSLYANLNSDMAKLLPDEAPSVQALKELRARSAGLSFLGVLVDAGDASRMAEANAYVDALASRVRSYPPELVRRVETGNAEETRFFRHNAPLYIDADDLEDVFRRVNERRRWEIMRGAFGSIDDEDDDEAPPLDFSDLQRKYDVSSVGGPTDGRYANADMHVSLLLIQAGDDTSALYERLSADLGTLPEGMRMGFTGDVAATTEEMQALVADLALASVLVVLAVALVIVAYYRWWRSLLVLFPPVLLAAVFAFAVCTLPPFSVTELNSNTAFLGAIIVGNGINVGIMLLARYLEERRRGVPVVSALEIAVSSTATGTLAAAAAAGVAYCALGFTQFRGFGQFGAIGALGMAFAWVLAYLLMPSLLVMLDRDVVVAPRRRAFDLGVPLLNVVRRYPGLLVLASIVMAVVALRATRDFSKTMVESDFSKLRRGDTWVVGEGYWGARMNKLLNRYLQPLVIVADTEEDAERIGAALRAKLSEPPFNETLARVRTLSDLIPTDVDRKLEIVARLRKLVTPTVLERLPEDKRASVRAFMDDGELRALTLADIPESLLARLRERDGTLGKMVLVYPQVNGGPLWEGARLTEVVAALRSVATTAVASGHTPGRVAGGMPLTADILAAVRHDGRTSCIIALIGVMIMVTLIVRRRVLVVLVIGSLCTGVLYQLALMVGFALKLNFANFIALPITFGVGVDYAANVVARYIEDGERAIEGTMASTGGAIVLCSLTTMIGYGSLLVARNQALFSFGALAVLGELCCLIVALIFLPAFLVVMQRQGLVAGAERPPRVLIR